MIRTVIAATLGLSLMAAGAIDAYAASDCKHPWKDVAAKLTKAHAKIAEVPAKEREVIVTNFNASPPATNMQFDHVYAAMLPSDADHLYVFFALKGCTLADAKFTVDEFAKMLTPVPSY